MVRIVLLLGFLACALPAHACWQEAGNRYQIAPALLYAIARTESALNPAASHRNHDGSVDIGLMQINSAWLPTLAAYGISERDLFRPCTSIHVGAWLLARNFQRFGYTWEAVGAYNAASPGLRLVYVDKVQRNLLRISSKHLRLAAAPAKAGADPLSIQLTGD